jgi:uncharacterized protein
MLLRIQIENVFCFSGLTTLSMIASGDKRHSNHVRKSGRPGFPDVLRATGIYGANGHGKTKLVDAILFIKRMACGETDNTIDLCKPFRLRDTENEPSRFVINFRETGVDYEYGLIISNGSIEQEWLYEKEKRQEVLIFTREKYKTKKGSTSYKYNFGAKLRNSQSPSEDIIMSDYLKFIGTSISEKVSFLSEAVEKKVERLSRAHNWFADTLQVVKADSNYGNLHGEAAQDKDFLSYLSKAICKSDTGIGELKVKESVIPEELIHELPVADGEILSHIKGMDKGEQVVIGSPEGPSIVIKKEKRGYKAQRFVTVHHGKSMNVEFDLDDESSGTRRLLDLYPMLYSLKKKDRVYVVDELDRKLHPILSYNFVNAFLAEKQGQIIFTTHTTHLLDLDLLRRDEIWLIQKNRETGSAETYSLQDFNVRNDLDVRKGYLQGRFGGIPFIGDVNALGWC